MLRQAFQNAIYDLRRRKINKAGARERGRGVNIYSGHCQINPNHNGFIACKGNRAVTLHENLRKDCWERIKSLDTLLERFCFTSCILINHHLQTERWEAKLIHPSNVLLYEIHICSKAHAYFLCVS